MGIEYLIPLTLPLRQMNQMHQGNIENPNAWDAMM